MMGYTHYWTQQRDFTPDEFEEVSVATEKICQCTKVLIFGPLGDGPPIFASNMVSLNGDAATGNDHETFSVSQVDTGGDFCKTARKPYDVVVTAVLTYLSNRWNFAVDSDGDVEDWEAGVRLAEQALGREFYNPLIRNQLEGDV